MVLTLIPLPILTCERDNGTIRVV